jgi:hypothetical protein
MERLRERNPLFNAPKAGCGEPPIGIIPAQIRTRFCTKPE